MYVYIYREREPNLEIHPVSPQLGRDDLPVQGTQLVMVPRSCRKAKRARDFRRAGSSADLKKENKMVKVKHPLICRSHFIPRRTK